MSSANAKSDNCSKDIQAVFDLESNCLFYAKVVMKLQSIKSEEEYKVALKDLDMLLEKDPSSLLPNEVERLKSLMDVVEEYEKIHFPLN
ncbi:hypothetical protein [Spongiibacter tropicus]|uniref:hypothetical protein n=1 Tax=Spongiibacter tropicus TaxID=454602 RepID=UPI0035BE79FE